MSISNVHIVGGQPQPTYQVNSTNTAQGIADAKKYVASSNVNDKPCHGAMITIETNDIRYSFSTTPTQSGGLGVGHLAGDGDALKLNSFKAVNDFKFISNIAGAHAMLTITIGV